MRPHRNFLLSLEITMQRITACTLLALTATLLLASGVVRAQDKVDVRVVNYDGLADAVRHLKGKIVIVDFWAHW
jgi:hypothetical protein